MKRTQIVRVILTLFAAPAMAAVTNYLPLLDEVMATRFPLKRASAAMDGKTQVELSFGKMFVVVSSSGTGLLLSGDAAAGRRWSLAMDARATAPPSASMDSGTRTG